MDNIIGDKLKEIENDNDITILYACESGSRAWGFDNAESDWDVRFIYKRKNVRDYVSLTEKNEVIEYMGGELDIVGWDIKKALLLHCKSNPNLREWLESPIKYRNWDKNIFDGLPDFDKAILKYHYTNIVSNNWKKLSQNDLELTKRVIKMFMYNCRCILVWKAIDEGKNPSINIFELLSQVSDLDDAIKDDILSLADYYKNNCQDSIDLDIIGTVREWMGENLEVMKGDFPEKEVSPDLKIYDERLFDIIFPNFR